MRRIKKLCLKNANIGARKCNFPTIKDTMTDKLTDMKLHRG